MFAYYLVLYIQSVLIIECITCKFGLEQEDHRIGYAVIGLLQGCICPMLNSLCVAYAPRPRDTHDAMKQAVPAGRDAALVAF